MIEAVRVINVAETDHSSSKPIDEQLFEKYELSDLQCSICIFFYFHEFMDGVKIIFQDAQKNSANLNLDEECSVITIYTAA